MEVNQRVREHSRPEKGSAEGKVGRHKPTIPPDLGGSHPLCFLTQQVVTSKAFTYHSADIKEVPRPKW